MDSPLLHARIYTHSARAPHSLSLRAGGVGGRGFAVSCRLGVPLGVRLQANLSEKKKKKKPSERRKKRVREMLGEGFVL